MIFVKIVLCFMQIHFKMKAICTSSVQYAGYLMEPIRIVQRILLDLPEFMEFIKDAKGLPLSDHIESGYKDILRFLGI